MAKGFTYFAGAVVVLVLMKDGTLGRLIQDGANFGKNAATGLKPLTTIA